MQALKQLQIACTQGRGRRGSKTLHSWEARTRGAAKRRAREQSKELRCGGCLACVPVAIATHHPHAGMHSR